jgi:glycosyltransferase involved in cell wall biosynthesis
MPFIGGHVTGGRAVVALLPMTTLGHVRILLVVSRVPWPPRRGDQLLALQLATLLSDPSGLAHDVTLLIPRHRQGSSVIPDDVSYRIETYDVRRVNVLGGLWSTALHRRPLQSALFHHPDLRRRIRVLSPSQDLVILQLSRLVEYLDAVEEARVAVDFIDSLALNMDRRAAFDRWWLRRLLNVEARLVLRAEQRMLAAAAFGLLVSERDRAWLASRVGDGSGERLVVVPVVATRTEEPEDTAPRAEPHPALPPCRLCFTGNLGYFVNDDGIRWWLRHVWPEVQRTFPQAALTIAGARPTRRLRRLVDSAAGDVELIAQPRDLGAVLEASDIAIAPMRAGSGLPIKVLEAWVKRKPVVASSWAAAGVSGRHEHDLLIADDARTWCQALSRLRMEPELARALINGGRARIERDFSARAARAALDDAFGRIDAW